MLRAPSYEKGLKKAKEDFWIGRKAFFAGQERAPAAPMIPKKIVKRPDQCGGTSTARGQS